MSDSLNHWVNWFVQTHWIIQEQNNWLSLWLNHWIIELTDSFKHTESLRNETTDCLYEWFTESLSQLIRSNTLNHSGTKQLIVFMIESLNHWVNWFVQTHRIIQERNNWLSLWVIHWIIELTDSFKHTESFRNKTTDCLYEWFTESLS